MAHVSDLIAERHRRVPRGARAQEPAALHHLRQRRRRQEHADRPAAVRVARCCSRTSSRRSRPTRSRSGTQGGELDFALLLDGLRPSASRASRSTSPTASSRPTRRKFIVADTPGPRAVHAQHGHRRLDRRLRVILIDARKGVLTQTRRHSFLVSLLGIRHVVARGQQDGPRRLLARSASSEIEARVPRVRRRDRARATSPASRCRRCKGDNIVEPQRRRCPGTHGPTLMELPRDGRGRRRRGMQRAPFRLPVQWVNRPEPRLPRLRRDDRRRAPSRPGDRVRVLPSGRESTRRAHRHATTATSTQAVAGPVGHAHARRRDRRQPRRRDRRRRRARRGRRPVRGDASSGWTRSRCCRGRTYLLKIGTQHRRPRRSRRSSTRSTSTRSSTSPRRRSS